MNESSPDRTQLAAATLRLLPERVRRSLIEDRSFLNDYGLATDARVSFANALTVERSSLFSRVRRILGGKDKVVSLADVDGASWTLSSTDRDGVPGLLVSNGTQTFLLPDLSLLSPDAEARRIALSRSSSEVNFPAGSRTRWDEILRSRELTDDELGALHEDLQDTPVRVTSKIGEAVLSGSAGLAALVPRSLRYYERLVGTCNHSQLTDYAQTELRRHCEQLIGWRPYEGFLSCLLLSSHSSIVKQIPVDALGTAEVVRAYDWLSQHGDLISQLGAFELGISLVCKHPSLDSALLTIAKRFRDDDAASATGRFQLLSALTALVDGELSRYAIFRDKPPFWRRLAAIAQASIIERNMIAATSDWSEIVEWAFQTRGRDFYFQTLVDLRREPRWLPDFAGADQLKEEFIGRAIGAAHAGESGLTSELRVLTVSDTDQSLRNRARLPNIFLPGPLEGATGHLNEMPPEMAKEMEARLQTDALEPASFTIMVNAALVFRLDLGHADLAARGLRAANYHLNRASDGQQLLAVISGLARVSAVTRSVVLADELAILVRRSRSEGRLSVTEAFQIGLIAAASRAEIPEWCKFVGNWITDLAFACSSVEEAKVLHADLLLLCRSVQSLWTTCGRAEAALQSYLSS